MAHESPSIAVDVRAGSAVITWPDAQPELEVWLRWFDRVLAHPSFEAGFGIVSDRRALTASPDPAFVRGFLHAVAAYAASGRFNGRWATVVEPSQAAVYGMGRMTEILSEDNDLKYRVFTDLDEALAWVSARGQDPSDERLAQ